MKTYKVKIKTIAPYLQARFSEDAQKSLKVKSGTKAKVDDENMWKPLSYIDDKGFYIPTMQIKHCLVNGGKSVKKKPYGSFKDLVKCYFFVKEDKIHIGKKKPDYINESFPKRISDGARVRSLKPAFNTGLEIDFTLEVTNDDIDEPTIKLIMEKAGLENGIGAWRPENGRWKLVNLKKI